MNLTKETPSVPIQAWQARLGELYFLQTHYQVFVPIILIQRDSRPAKDPGMWLCFVTPRGLKEFRYDQTIYLL